MKAHDTPPSVTRIGCFDMQVCVPSEWPDEQTIQFAENENPSGTSDWGIRREGDPALAGDPERTQCSKSNTGVHVMLDA